MKFQVMLIEGVVIVDTTDCSEWEDVVRIVNQYEQQMEDDRFSMEIINVTNDPEV